MLTLHDYLSSQNACKMRVLLGLLQLLCETREVSIFEGAGQDDAKILDTAAPRKPGTWLTKLSISEGFMSHRLASCSCGQLTAAVIGEPVRVSICHCLACQRRTGSVFGQQARFRREDVSLSGASSEYVRVGDEGTRVEFHFCPNCGSTVYWKLAGLEGYLAIAVGAFADPNFPEPRVSVYESRKHGWVLAPVDAEHIP